jgi:hypothetical protein
MRVASRLLSTAAVAAALTVSLAGAGLAQDATPGAGEEQAGGFPNHLHLGTCADLSPDVAEPLANLTFPEWVPSMAGEAGDDIEVVLPDPNDFGNAPIPVAVAVTEVPVALGEILAGKHALNVHDAMDPSIYIACGNVGGITDPQGDLFVGLDESDGSGYSGAAWFHDNGSSTTIVVMMTNPELQPAIEMGLSAMAEAAAAEAEAAATPEAAPAATPAAATDATPTA